MDASSLRINSGPFSLGSSQNPKNRHLGHLGLRRSSQPCMRCRAIGNGRHGRDGGDWNYGRSVDEEMIVLRKRIHEMRMVERNDSEPPVEWMDWEKRYYAHYDSDVCEAVGLLQSLLMNSRPSMVVGMVALLALSVPTSVFIVLFHLIEAAKGVIF